MAKNRTEYKETLINNRDPEKHFEFQDIGYGEYYAEIIDRLLNRTQSFGKTLHIGCGTAAFEILLCDKIEFGKFYGLEQSRTLIRIGEAVLSRFGYTKRISLKSWDDDNLPFPDNEFDAVISLSSIHQWKNPEKTFLEIERVRKKDGIVFLSDFRREQFFLPYYFFVRKMRSAFGKEVGSNLRSAFKASYTTSQIREILKGTGLTDWTVDKNGKWFQIISQPARQDLTANKNIQPSGVDNIEREKV